MYESITRGIRIEVDPDFLDDQSDPDEDHYVWAYTVRIANESGETVRVCSRRWRVVDARGRSETVSGDGVVGEQPVLFPGDEFVYSSGAPLAAPSGMMLGAFQMETANGESFEVDVPAFSLDSPHDRTRIH